MARLVDPQLASRRRRQILDASLACFRRRGFHQTTMQEICAEANVSAGSLYRYFDAKADIIMAIAVEPREADKVVERASAKGALIESLCALARGFFEKVAGDDGALIADVIAEAGRDPRLAAMLARIDADRVQHCVKAIRAAQSRGEVDPDLDPVAAADTLFAAIEGIGLRRAMLHNLDAEEAVAQFRTLAERYLAWRP